MIHGDEDDIQSKIRIKIRALAALAGSSSVTDSLAHSNELASEASQSTWEVSVSLPTPGIGDRAGARGDALADPAEVIMDDMASDVCKRRVNERIDIRVGVAHPRRWGREDKLHWCESPAPNAVVTEVARRYEVSTDLLYTWRKQALPGLLEGFTPVRIVADAEASTLPAIEGAKDTVGGETKPVVRRSLVTDCS
jgi:transposase